MVPARDRRAVAEDIPSLSNTQHSVFREFIQRHRDETEGRISVNPIWMARVLARDKPAAEIDLKGEKTHPNFDDSDAYLHDLCDTLDLYTKKIKDFRGWTVSYLSTR